MTVKQFMQNLRNQNAKTLQRIMSSKDEYTQFLNFTARLYKYPLMESLSIYAQKPDAQAIGTMEEWNNQKIGRSVKKGAQALKILDSNNPNRYKNVYDLSDTHGRDFAYPVRFFIPEEIREPLIRHFGTETTGEDFNFSNAFALGIEKHVDEVYNETIANIKENVTNLTPLQSQILDDADFKKLVEESVVYCLCQRFDVPSAYAHYIGASLVTTINNTPDNSAPNTIADYELLFNKLDKFSSHEAAVTLGNVNQIMVRQAINYVNASTAAIKKEMEVNHGQRSVEVSGRPQSEPYNWPVQKVHGNAPRREEDILSKDGAAQDGLDRGRSADTGVRGTRGHTPDIPSGSGAAGRSGDGDGGRGRHGRADVSGQVQRHVDGVHAAPASAADERVGGTGNLGGNGSESADGDVADDRRLGEAVRREEQEATRRFSENSAMGERPENVGRGNSDNGDSLQNPLNRVNEQNEGVHVPEAFTETHDVDVRITKTQDDDLQGANPQITDSHKGLADASPFLIDSHNIDWDSYVEYTRKDISRHTEPFVVMQWSESPRFAGFESSGSYENTLDFERMTFAEADAKFKEVEAIEIAERIEQGKYGGYHKTSGMIFYKADSDDTELTAYEFRYDIGDYQGERSGLYNHINNFWTNVQTGLNGGKHSETVKSMSFTQEDVDQARHMLSILQNDLASQVKLDDKQLPHVIMNDEQSLKVHTGPPEPAPSTQESINHQLYRDFGLFFPEMTYKNFQYLCLRYENTLLNEQGLVITREGANRLRVEFPFYHMEGAADIIQDGSILRTALDFELDSKERMLYCVRAEVSDEKDYLDLERSLHHGEPADPVTIKEYLDTIAHRFLLQVNIQRPVVEVAHDAHGNNIETHLPILTQNVWENLKEERYEAFDLYYGQGMDSESALKLDMKKEQISEVDTIVARNIDTESVNDGISSTEEQWMSVYPGPKDINYQQYRDFNQLFPEMVDENHKYHRVLYVSPDSNSDSQHCGGLVIERTNEHRFMVEADITQAPADAEISPKDGMLRYEFRIDINRDEKTLQCRSIAINGKGYLSLAPSLYNGELADPATTKESLDGALHRFLNQVNSQEPAIKYFVDGNGNNTQTPYPAYTERLRRILGRNEADTQTHPDQSPDTLLSAPAPSEQLNLFQDTPTPAGQESLHKGVSALGAEKVNYQNLQTLFPEIMSGEYSYLRLKAGSAMMPLSVEWIGQDRLSVMHTHVVNGDLCYDPMIVFQVDRELQTATAVEFEQSMPPLYQRIEDDGIGHSIDGNGIERTIRGLQSQLNDFSVQWFDNIAQQGYVPETASIIVDGEDVRITFDEDGNPITPEPKEPEAASVISDSIDKANPQTLPQEEVEPPTLPPEVVSGAKQLSSPPPVFFVDWKEAQADFDLSLYKDRDIIGYNKDGVEYALGRIGDTTYITNTTGITPWGEITGHTNIPRSIWEQMHAYRNGEMTDEQVRENYINALDSFKNQKKSMEQLQIDPALASNVLNFFAGIPQDARPFQMVRVYNNVSGESRRISNLLENPENAVEIFEAMKPIMDSTFYSDQYYERRKLGYEMLGAHVEAIHGREQVQAAESESLQPDADSTIRHTEIIDGIDFAFNTTKAEEVDLEDLDDKEEKHWNAETNSAEQTGADRTENHGQLNLDLPANFVIQSEESIGMASGKTKFRQNVDAIQVLKAIESESRFATPNEQAILAKYSGFGGIPQAFDPNNEGWAKEFQQLKEITTEAEHASLSVSTLNAHYTSIEVVQAMYNGLERLGFKSGTVLEPSMGTGHFFGAMPQNMADSSRLYGVELDDLTGRIAKQLYPQANIEINGFEKANIPDNIADVAVGNVPFGAYKVHDTKFNKHNFMIHDYFIAKSLDKVRPGGIVVYVTSSGTMDKANTSLRKYVAERAELLGAIRLPNTAFKQSAGTEVTTDIIFLQKRDGIVDATNEDWVYTGQYSTGAKNEDGNKVVLPLNRYFIQNPHMMLGEMAYSKEMYGNERSTALLPFLKPDNDVDLDEWFTERFAEIREDYRGELDYYAYESLSNFEKAAKEHGYFDISVVEEMPIPVYSSLRDPVAAYDAIFGYRLEEIVEDIGDYVNWEDKPDKSNIPLKTLLQDAIEHLPQSVMRDYATLDDLEALQEKIDTIPADPRVKNFCYTIVDDNIYYRENSVMSLVEMPLAKEARLKSMIELREMTRHIIDIQVNDCSDDELTATQERLEKAYDNFVKRYKNINTSYNKSIFKNDADFALLSALERIDDNGNIEKSPIFHKRTIAPYRKVESAGTSEEALAVSLYEKGCVDIGFMQSLSGKTFDEITRDLQGQIFKDAFADALDPDRDNENILYKNWVTADEYLSGKVVWRLEHQRGIDNILSEPSEGSTFAGVNLRDLYGQNVPALELVQPVPLKAHEINVNIGSIWIEPEYYHQFIAETFKLNSMQNNQLKVEYFDIANRWHVEAPSGRSGVETTQNFGTERMDAYSLMQIMLNQQQPEIRDPVETPDGKMRRILNRDETIAIKDKQTVLDEAFKKWIFDDPARREELVAKYNSLYNSERAREYDGSFLRFEGMNPAKTLEKHQRDAVARIIFGGNTLLAHCVGAGKTYIMAAAAMEMKRMGIINKPFFVVPNHIVSQWSNEFLDLYPGANILTAPKDGLNKENRKIFLAKMATGDWDAVIVPQSVFGQIPVSYERQHRKLNDELRTARDFLNDLNSGNREEKQENRWSIKQIEASIKGLQAQLEKLNDMKKDDLITFEDTGVDALFVDEAHAYKNKNIFTKMTRVAGLQTRSNTKRTKDMEMKVEYINEVSNAPRNVVFATGTPVSNSMVELYTMQSYLQKDKLKERKLHHFDNWAANYGQVVSQVELAPSGQTFRTKQRFAKFQNLPEMMNMFRMVADIKTPDMLNLPVPNIATGKPIIIDSEASESQKELVKALVNLSDKIASRKIPPEQYNMLMVTYHGKMGALDMRAVNIDLFRKLDARFNLGIDFNKLKADDYAGSKVNACINKTFEIYKSTEKEKLTQMIFCDQSTPNDDGKGFTVYQDIKNKLISKGVKPEEIAFIHDAKSNEAKEKIFNKMRNGSIRVLIGSTSKMGTGTNAQRLLVALHNLDCPWRPADLEQRIGRIVRQGNLNDEVGIYNYVTKGTFDAYSWQIIETKQRYISQVMSGKISANSMEEIDELVLNHAEVKAIATGNPHIKKKMELETEVHRLKVLEKQYMANKYSNQDLITKHLPNIIKINESYLKGIEKDIILRNKNNSSEFSIKLGNKIYDERAKAGGLLVKAAESGKYANKVIGNFKGFSIMLLHRFSFFEPHKVRLTGSEKYDVELSDSGIGSVTKIENVLKQLDTEKERVTLRLSDTQKHLETLKAQIDLPFEHAERLEEAQKELNKINQELDIGKEDSANVVDESIADESDAAKDVEFVAEDDWELDD